MSRIRKIISLIMSVCMFLSFSVINADAGYLTSAQVADMEERFTSRCAEILLAVNHDDYFHGGCADWTSDQLKGNGIGYWYQGNYNCGYHDAHLWLDELDDGAVTETGYTQVKYYGANCLNDIVFDYGNYPVYNIVVCWQHGNGEWSEEGHVCYIWAIYDGYIYYSDTFSRYNAQAGELVKVPLDTFAKLYEETNGDILGAVHFQGAEDIHYRLTERMSTEFVVDSDCDMLGAPAYTVNGEDTAIGYLMAGDKIHVVGTYIDRYGERWLKLEGGEWISYENAHKTGNFSALVLEDVSVPIRWPRLLAYSLTGMVRSYLTPLKSVSLTVTSEEGEVVIGGDMDVSGEVFNIASIDENVYFEHLKIGNYTYRIEAENGFEKAVLLEEQFEVFSNEEYNAYARLQEKSVTTERKRFEPADTDLSGAVDEGDVDSLLKTVFAAKSGGSAYLSDVNGDGSINLTDLSAIINEIGK